MNPGRIIQIVSGSRSGSSLLKTVLAKSPDLVSLAGEEEPYFAKSQNGYNFNSVHDGFTVMENPELFRQYVEAELSMPIPRHWAWRLRLQYTGAQLENLLRSELPVSPSTEEPWLKKHGIWGFYDGCKPEERLPFTGKFVYEMLPYVKPNPPRELPKDYTLLLKSPYNIYRPGVLEQIYPGVEIKRILLCRNPAATINGLIDGWESPYGFFKHLTPYGWWKFDLPPKWETVANKDLSVIATFQWRSSYSQLHLFQENSITVKFEHFINDPSQEIAKICQWAEIEPPEITKLPLVMATEQPKPFRWKHRQYEIMDELSTPTCQNLIKELDYRDQSQWY